MSKVYCAEVKVTQTYKIYQKASDIRLAVDNIEFLLERGVPDPLTREGDVVVDVVSCTKLSEDELHDLAKGDDPLWEPRI